MQMIHRYMCAWMNLSMYVLPWTETMPSWVLSRYGQRTGRALVCNRCQHAKEHGRFGRRQWGTFLWRRDFYVCEKGRWAKKSWETLPGTSSDLPIPPQTDEREARSLPTLPHPTPERWEKSLWTFDIPVQYFLRSNMMSTVVTGVFCVLARGFGQVIPS